MVVLLMVSSCNRGLKTRYSRDVVYQKAGLYYSIEGMEVINGYIEEQSGKYKEVYEVVGGNIVSLSSYVDGKLVAKVEVKDYKSDGELYLEKGKFKVKANYIKGIPYGISIKLT